MMRVISQFRDYYDGVAALGGFDKDDVTYVRVTKELCIRSDGASSRNEIRQVLSSAISFLNGMPILRFNREYRIVPVVICFCGKIYGVWRINGKIFHNYPSIVKYLKEQNQKYQEKKKLLGYCMETYNLSFAGKILSNLDEEEKRYLKYKKNKFTYRYFAEENINRVEQGKEIGDDSFIFLKAPAFVIESGDLYSGEYNIFCNPILRNYGFPILVDPYTASQELEMFLGNNLVKTDEPSSERTDDLIRDAKGFDNKSFKNIAPGKKHNRKLNKARKRKNKSSKKNKL